MSFGVSIGDVLLLVKLAKDTVHNCRHAPGDFAEASRVSQSLYLILEGVKTEYQNPDSPLLKDDRTQTDFAIHFKNCETSLKPLADLIDKHKKLANPSVRVIDRWRFPKKDYLEYRGNLAFYTARLSEFLHMVGLGSLGRIEQKVEDIKGHLPNLMNKTFRTKLNEAGFTSNVLREHESAIFLRIRELTQCGLLDTDVSSSLWEDEDASSSTVRPYHMPFHSGTTTAVDSDTESEPTVKPTPASPQKFIATAESDAESEKTITPKPSVQSLRRNKSDGRGDESKRRIRSRRSSISMVGCENTSPRPDKQQGPSEKPRVWRNAKGHPILKGTFKNFYIADNKQYILLLDTDRQEVGVPIENLSDADLAFVNAIESRTPEKTQSPGLKGERALPQKVDLAKEGGVHRDFKPEATELPRRTHPRILVGTRTRPKIVWAYRKKGLELPNPAPLCGRSLLTSDLLPQAASSGDLKHVKKLLVSGEHIESKGPKSWTETTTEPDGNGGTRTNSTRHSYPETTALYRAAYAGWLDIVLYLLNQGADVNARDGYDGKTGDPILFKVIRNGHSQMTRVLLEYGAKMEAYGPETALHVASSQPKRGIVRLALDYGAYIDAKDYEGQTPLYLASAKGFASIVELLLEEAADTSIRTSAGRTALYKAGGNGRDDIVELLLRYGADPALGRGRYGETTLYKAAWYDDLDTVDLLLDYETDVNIRNKKKMESYKGPVEKILHGIMAGLSNDHAIMNAWGKTALHAAAYRGHEETLKLLIDAGADIEAVGNDGQTPMYLAAQQKHQGIVQILLKAGAQLESEKHDPVLALLNERNERKEGNNKQVAFSGKQREMAKIGSSDPFVGIIADFTKGLTASRRLRDVG
ncbi:MAG: hypothetical protein L6R41_007137 [Letrouitia leprolyta]|nr:MAG: hypothetical protein L6R41_007137 [Letrouitia leprolyta]